jgi:hypothetical protein
VSVVVFTSHARNTTGMLESSREFIILTAILGEKGINLVWFEGITPESS